jgi:hypothetical protein
VDWLDPRTLPALTDADPVWLSLSDRIDCGCWLDRVDYEWARSIGEGRYRGLWYHTYGSGDMIDGLMQRPNLIYARKQVSGRMLNLHREVARRAYGPPWLLNMVVDHKNGDTLDNRRCNLQWVSRSYNAINIAGSYLRERLIREVETRL